jgi:hypothetical protein
MVRRKAKSEEPIASEAQLDTGLEVETLDREGPALPKEKVSLAPVGLLTIFLSATTLIFLLFSNFSDQHTLTPEQKSFIPTEITLSAKQFLEFSNSNVCDGRGVLTGLSRATLVVTGTGWSKSERLGSGSLNAQGQCVYTPRINPPPTFSGGQISASIIFSTARSPQYPVNVGPYPPYKTIRVSLSLG